MVKKTMKLEQLWKGTARFTSSSKTKGSLSQDGMLDISVGEDSGLEVGKLYDVTVEEHEKEEEKEESGK